MNRRPIGRMAWRSTFHPVFVDEESLLALEIDAVFGIRPDPPTGVRQLVKPAPRAEAHEVEAVFGWSPRAAVLAVSEVVAPLALDLEPAAAQPFCQDVIPAVIERLSHALETPTRTISVSGGPSFIFPDELPEVQVSLPVIVWDESGQERARTLDRPSNWEADEWAQLIGGELGPWAMALDGNHPVSITFTPAATAIAAEAGAWTRADHRGAGLAAAVTRAWWKLERARKQIVLYSTDRGNHASLAVARKLRLTPLGWLWSLRIGEKDSPR